MAGLTADMFPLSLPQRTFPILPLIIGWLTKATRWVTLTKQEILSFLKTPPPVFVLLRFFRIIRVIQSLLFCEVFCRQLFVLFPLVIMLSVYTFRHLQTFLRLCFILNKLREGKKGYYSFKYCIIFAWCDTKEVLTTCSIIIKTLKILYCNLIIECQYC